MRICLGDKQVRQTQRRNRLKTAPYDVDETTWSIHAYSTAWARATGDRRGGPKLTQARSQLLGQHRRSPVARAKLWSKHGWTR